MAAENTVVPNLGIAKGKHKNNNSASGRGIKG